ncbi:hypothetical protein GIW06_20345 [Pseudomonas syringae]|nr:hypothetical protein [Pseudomonas syringae]POD16895.1 hypothetical protein BKM04_23975 [Pseudomonas syringae pv. syringae]MCF5205926.1 hypothetical protein [Pseudomonas syringae]MCF5273314.1 hypothetical protein [Pseudomonas syringae]MCF5275048.1 hypothetical protein [Pseudomonas syringae]
MNIEHSAASPAWGMHSGVKPPLSFCRNALCRPERIRMSHSELCLKPIHELLADENGKPTQFWIPAYQRGCRWKPLQVIQLLEDIREFSQRRNPQPEEFYCLQPLEIKATEQRKKCQIGVATQLDNNF